MNQKLIEQLTDYNPNTGIMVWKKRKADMFSKPSYMNSWNTRNAGNALTTMDGKGYFMCGCLGKIYRVHRLIWLKVYGEWPTIIDHVNGVRTDNRLINLRQVTNQQNHMNQRKSSKNTSGVTGVYFMNSSSLWCAQMKFNGKTYHLGSNKDKNTVILMRKNEEDRLGFSKRHGE